MTGLKGKSLSLPMFRRELGERRDAHNTLNSLRYFDGDDNHDYDIRNLA